MRTILVVTWSDITKNTNDNNFVETVSPDARLTVMISVGYFYEETETTLMLVQEYWSDGGKLVPRDWLVIPKAQIISIKQYKEK
jgi:hypothetical protein